TTYSGSRPSRSQVPDRPTSSSTETQSTSLNGLCHRLFCAIPLDFIAAGGRPPHKQWSNASEQLTGDFTVRIRSKGLLVFPGTDAYDFAAVLEDLTKQTAGLLLYPVNKFAEDSHGLLLFAGLNRAVKQTCIHHIRLS